MFHNVYPYSLYCGTIDMSVWSKVYGYLVFKHLLLEVYIAVTSIVPVWTKVYAQ